MFIKSSSSSSCKVETIGSLPTSSGINPYFIKSSGSTFFTMLEVFFLLFLMDIFAENNTCFINSITNNFI
jgi:hypothetical protein